MASERPHLQELLARGRQGLPQFIGEWLDELSRDNRFSLMAPEGHVFFAYGPKLVACGLSMLPTPDGNLNVDSVTFMCPVCDNTGRLDRDTKPFRIEDRRVVFRTGDGPRPAGPLLTVYSPVKCGVKGKLVDGAGGEQPDVECPFEAVIRGGIAFDMSALEGILLGPSGAVAAADAAYRQAHTAYAQAGQKPNADKAAADLQLAFKALYEHAQPRLQAGLRGEFEFQRGGPDSLVGCWDAVDASIAASTRVMQWAAAK